MFATIIVALALWPPLYIYIYGVSSNSIKAQYLDDVRGTTADYAGFISLMLAQGIHEEIRTLDEFMLRNNVVFAQLVVGEKVYESSLTTNRTYVFKEDVAFGEHDDNVYYLSVPVTTADGSGFFYAGFDESLILDQLDQLNYYIFLSLLVFWLVWVAITLILAKPMSRAIRTMTESANKIAEGKEVVVEQGYFLSEFAELGRSLDEMSVELSNRRDILVHSANHDPLSGIANRLKFSEVLHSTIANMRSDGFFSVMLMDIDRFKKINDSYGHLLGDRLITYIAKLLKRKFGQVALVARVGGDEFALIMYAHSAESLKEKMSSLLSEHKDKIFLQGHSISFGFSAGIAEFRKSDPITADELMHRADIAMYASKLGGGGATIYSEEALSTHKKKLQIISELQSLDPEDMQHGIYLDYQPKYDLNSGELVGVEALCRWQNKRIGFLGPTEFIQNAEEHGTITKLTCIVVDRALAQQADWKRTGLDIPIAINVSPTDILDEKFFSYLSTKIEQYQIEPEKIELEVTEYDFVKDAGLFNQQLLQLKQLGIRLSIDDFGSGYANLNGLRNYPFSSIKIDQEFIRYLTTDNRDREIVEAILMLANQLRIDVIAEGIESVSEMNLLIELGCQYGQGYYFSMPVPPDQIEKLFSFNQSSEKSSGVSLQ